MVHRSRSRSPHLGRSAVDQADGKPKSLDASSQKLIDRGKASLKVFCDKHGIPESHGYGHALRVLQHAELAVMAASPAIAPERAQSVCLAAMFHDMDDRKYFPDCPKGTYPNAEKLMRELGVQESVTADAVRMIGWVSCSKNGNNVPPQAISEPELLWPRWADRIEAAGEVGVVRCWQYNCELKNPPPYFTEKTPRPRSEDEVWALATPERFEQYQKSGGSSESMLDHYFDKLLRVARPPMEIVKNKYLEETMAAGAAPLVKVLLHFGKSGEFPIEELRAMEARIKS